MFAPMPTAPANPASATGVIRLATPDDFEAIHRLNYRTFVEEIPQHPPNAERRLVDRFHDENVYAVYEVQGRIVGMVSGRTQRPFSLDQKLGAIDPYLPPDCRPVEIRLLAVDPAFRATRVFARLMRCISLHFLAEGYDLGVISGTTRQLALYRHLGFTPFGRLIGTPDALYQPMYIDAARVQEWPAAMQEDEPGAAERGGNFLPGPVAMTAAVQAAFARPATSHRADAFLARYAAAQSRLCALTGARHATLLLGSGTLANDVVGMQLAQLPGRGVVLSNGEFGDRIIDHAERLGLRHTAVRARWGDALDLQHVTAMLRETNAEWLWAVHSETSTGVVNNLEALRECARAAGAHLALDAISSLGALPVSLPGVWCASAVSGKALASYPGVAIVLHDALPMTSRHVPRYLDLGLATASGGVPFTQSSNLIEALATSLETTDWRARLAQLARDGDWVRGALERAGLAVLAPHAIASPVVHTVVLPAHASAQAIGTALRDDGWLVSFESQYLRDRNWLQLCLMGVYGRRALRGLVDALRAQVSRAASAAATGDDGLRHGALGRSQDRRHPDQGVIGPSLNRLHGHASAPGSVPSRNHSA
jgi:aspartate aminotransferase-like enzyme/predicted N-acetyltransferase YhbS